MTTDPLGEPSPRIGTRCGAFFALLSTAWLLGCQGQPDDGLNKVSVTGTVLVDDAPAKGVVVRFFRDGRPGETNADTPLGVTGEDGTFALSTNGDRDGAVPGTYRVTFTWKTGNAPGAKDRLGGRYTNLQKSTFEATVNVEDTELPPFRLETAPQSSAAAATARRRSPSLPPVSTP